jgi:hypothetical protein
MYRVAPAILAILVIAGCSRTPTSPEFVVPLVSTDASIGAGAGQPTASTHLSGDHEVPPRDTTAQGQAIFKLSEDGLTMSYKLIASNIENVIQAHIHQGSAADNGPIVVFLFGLVANGGGRHDGVLSEGTFTAANFIGPLAGLPMSALLSQMSNGNTYVNVHTNDGVAPTNTGPGDFPGGEIRGQIRRK